MSEKKPKNTSKEVNSDKKKSVKEKEVSGGKSVKKRNTRKQIAGEIVRFSDNVNDIPNNFNIPESQRTWITQPNIVTLMAYDYKTIQIRILISLIEHLKDAINEGLKGVPYEQLTLFKELSNDSLIRVSIPTKSFGVAPDAYDELKKSLSELASIVVMLDTKDPLTNQPSWVLQGLFSAYIPKETHIRKITIELKRPVAMALVNTDKGFTKFIKEVAFAARSKYTVRMYMLISGWRDKGKFKISYQKFRQWLNIGDKYSKYKDFHKRVLQVAKEELKKISNCWFEVSETYNPGESEPHMLIFIIYSAELSKKEKEWFEGQKNQLFHLMKNHLYMKDEQVSQIMQLLTHNNARSALNKVLYLGSYIKKHPTIKYPGDYCTKALKIELNVVGVIGEELEIEDIEDETEGNKE